MEYTRTYPLKRGIYLLGRFLRNSFNFSAPALHIIHAGPTSRHLRHKTYQVDLTEAPPTPSENQPEHYLPLDYVSHFITKPL